MLSKKNAKAFREGGWPRYYLRILSINPPSSLFQHLEIMLKTKFDTLNTLRGQKSIFDLGEALARVVSGVFSCLSEQ